MTTYSHAFLDLLCGYYTTTFLRSSPNGGRNVGDPLSSWWCNKNALSIEEVPIDTTTDEFQKTTTYTARFNVLLTGVQGEILTLDLMTIKGQKRFLGFVLFHMGNKPLDILSLGAVRLTLLVDGKRIVFPKANESKSNFEIKEDAPSYTEAISYRVSYPVLKQIANAQVVKLRADGNNRLEAEFAPENFKNFQKFVKLFPQ